MSKTDSVSKAPTSEGGRYGWRDYLGQTPAVKVLTLEKPRRS